MYINDAKNVELVLAALVKKMRMSGVAEYVRDCIADDPEGSPAQHVGLWAEKSFNMLEEEPSNTPDFSFAELYFVEQYKGMIAEALKEDK